LAVGMRQLNGVYTQLFNKLHGRTGHLFQGRYKSILIQKDSHLLEVSRYVVLNPVRAKMIAAPEAWKWSSYRATVGSDRLHPCLTVGWILGQFSRKRSKAEQEYRRFVNRGIGKETIWTDVRGQAILGGEEFADKLADHLRKHKRVQEFPKSQRYVERPLLEKLFTDTVVRDKHKRDRKIAEAVEKYLYSQREIAAHLGLHYTSVSRIINDRG